METEATSCSCADRAKLRAIMEFHAHGFPTSGPEWAGRPPAASQEWRFCNS
jgi:hypothetical protein